jgi:predicted transcriptional regulator
VYKDEHKPCRNFFHSDDSETKKRLDALSKRSRRSKSFLAAEAIVAYVEAEEWQFGEIQAGIKDLDSANEVSTRRFQIGSTVFLDPF